jgi:hypothetical protein
VIRDPAAAPEAGGGGRGRREGRSPAPKPTRYSNFWIVIEEVWRIEASEVVPQCPVPPQVRARVGGGGDSLGLRAPGPPAQDRVRHGDGEHLRHGLPADQLYEDNLGMVLIDTGLAGGTARSGGCKGRSAAAPQPSVLPPLGLTVHDALACAEYRQETARNDRNDDQGWNKTEPLVRP